MYSRLVLSLATRDAVVGLALIREENKIVISSVSSLTPRIPYIRLASPTDHSEI